VQFEFFREWTALKKYAHQKGVSIVGDIPLYMAYDSADVWAKPQLFKLDEDRRMTEVAGVPPDYFSATGQLWGNPLYDWEEQKKDGYAWWISRLHDALEMYDVVRVDHFRGLDRYYAIPACNQDAVVGRWCDGPKAELFTLAKQQLGEMNIIAEDLGVLDDGVKKLLADTAYPGMKILLFAFENEENDYLPKNIGHNSVCYTGTHDNDTAVGYFKRLSPDMLRYVRGNIRAALKSRNLSFPLRGAKDMTTALIHLLFECDACLSILPMQDLLYLDNSARMNTPATGENNWQFRLKSLPPDSVAEALSFLLKLYKRK
jgi:4-alpha-glucanotransferase